MARKHHLTFVLSVLVVMWCLRRSSGRVLHTYREHYWNHQHKWGLKRAEIGNNTALNKSECGNEADCKNRGNTPDGICTKERQCIFGNDARAYIIKNHIYRNRK